MSREIKFRAWNPYAKAMYDVDLLHIRNAAGQLDFNLTNSTYMSLVYQPNVVLMQYTGLEDGIGVDMCESDVVRIGTSYKAIIVWDEHAARFLLKPIGAGANSTRSLSSVVTQGRVIGNMYENPELLKGQTNG